MSFLYLFGLFLCLFWGFCIFFRFLNFYVYFLDFVSFLSGFLRILGFFDHPILDTRISFVLLLLRQVRTTPPWILKRAGVESSGRRLISQIGKTKRIAFFFQWNFFFFFIIFRLFGFFGIFLMIFLIFLEFLEFLIFFCFF